MQNETLGYREKNTVDREIERSTSKVIILVVKLTSDCQPCDSDVENIGKSEYKDMEDM